MKKGFLGSLVQSLRQHRFHSIFFKNFILILILMVLPGVGVPAIIAGYQNQLRQQSAENRMHASSEKIRSEMDRLVDNNKNIALKLATNKEIFTFASNPDIYDSYASIQAIDTIQRIISYAISTSGTASDIILYFRKTDYFVAVDSSWTGYAANNTRDIPEAVVRDDQYTRELFERNKGFVFIRAPIVNSGQIVGAVILKFRDDMLIGRARTLQADPRSRIIGMDAGGEILGDSLATGAGGEADILAGTAGLETGKIRRLQSRSGTMLVTKLESQNTPWTYLVADPLPIYLPESFFNAGVVPWLLLFLLLLSFCASCVVTYKIYQPIAFLTGLIRGYEPERAGGSRIRTMDEVALIAGDISASRIKNIILQSELEQKQELLHQAQTVACQAQINPHFLYNTLESLNWKALQLLNGKNDISSMISDLSQLLRSSLDNSGHLVTVQKELRHAELYLRIQQSRFRNRLEVTWQTETAVQNCQTVRLTLQPLIENAIIHALGKPDQTARVTIASAQEGSQVVFTVKDNGVGMTEEKLAEVRQRLSENVLERSEHLGLCNVHQRVRLHFGEAAGLTLDSRPGEGTQVTLRIPCITCQI